ncbi:MAG: hypothetical protein J7501_11655, partial [Bdellovibrio sp.]|nr:hypothetical protein [Bdellovibrio sp.]
MITRTLFRRNYFVFVSIIIVFIFMAFGSAFLVDYLDRPSTTQVRVVRPPNYVFRNLYEQLDNDPLLAFKKLLAANGSNPDNFLKFDLVDSAGKSLIDGKKVLPEALNAQQLAELAKDQPVRFGEQDFGPPRFDVAKTKFPGVYFVHRFMPPPGFMKGMMPPPPGMGGPGGPHGEMGPPPPGGPGPG